MGEQPPRRTGRRVVLGIVVAVVPRVVAAVGVLVVVYLAWSGIVGRMAWNRKATCLSNIYQLAKAMRLYTLDYNGYLFFDRGDAFSPPLAPGQAGQTQYLREAMSKYRWEHGMSEDIWYCPADPFAGKDLSSDPAWSGSFTYEEAGIGYKAVLHSASTDTGIQALYCQLVRDYSVDQMQVDHAFSSYRFYPTLHPDCEGVPTQIDIVKRCYRADWGAYGYWDVYSPAAAVFAEDLPFHFAGPRGPYRKRIYGKTWGYRDGHSVFHTYDSRHLTFPGGEQNDAVY